MTGPDAVRLRTVTKRFPGVQGTRTLKDAALGRRRRRPGVEALRDVDLVVPLGAAVGVVGANGAGKTTLLRIVAGVLVADAGTVSVQGRVGSLLELGAGFHPDLTGRESAVLTGVVEGLSRRAARARVDEICGFAGLERFIDHPLRTYSDGMRARLAFAIATASRPDVLLVDEVLAVGDVAFQQRCIERLRAFRQEGSTLLLVSHDPDLVRLLCERTVWLDAGEVVRDGGTDEVLDAYLASGGRPGAVLDPDVGGAVGAVRLLDPDGGPCGVLHVGAPLVVDVDLAPAPVPARLAVQVVRDDDLVCVDTSTELHPGDSHAVLRLDRLDLRPGRYRVAVGLYDAAWRRVLDFRAEAATMRVLGTAGAAGALAPPATWEVGADPAAGTGAGT